jgi:hypothetical protein
MKLLHPDLVEEYYNSIKESYPDLTLEQCNEICSAPFVEVKKGIESGEFPTVRLKFFGTFVAYPKRVKAILVQYEKMFKEHKITPHNYFKKKEQLEKFLNKKDEIKDNF